LWEFKIPFLLLGYWMGLGSNFTSFNYFWIGGLRRWALILLALIIFGF